MSRILITAAGSLALLGTLPIMAQPPVAAGPRVPDSDYALTPGADRFSTFISRNQRGNSVPINHARLTRLCGDEDGCSVRIGMHNWDNTGRVASREFLFYYNPRNGVWRASLGDAAGADSDNVTQHVNNSWACYMTDSSYANWNDQNDAAPGFALLSWREYNADCWLTIID